MKQLKFNYQIEQSERLLKLGLKKDTADMVFSYEMKEHENNYSWNLNILENPWDSYVWSSNDTFIPAWSLYRLLSMLPDDAPRIHWILDGADITIEFEDGDADFFPHKGDIYKGVVDCIEWLIKEGYFPKEYLV